MTNTDKLSISFILSSLKAHGINYTTKSNGIKSDGVLYKWNEINTIIKLRFWLGY